MALTATNDAETINMGGYASLSVGASGNATYNGTLTPSGTVYNLGGGGGTLVFASSISARTASACTDRGFWRSPIRQTVSAAAPCCTAGNWTPMRRHALGTGPLSISGGTLANTSGAALTLSTNNAQYWNADFTYAGANDLNLGTGNVSLSGSRTVTVASNTLTVGGAISGGSGDSLTKAGMGTLVLAGSDTYSGGTTINAGILQAGNANALGPATNSLTVASGTLDTHGFSIGVGSLSGSGHIDNLSGTGVYTLTVGSGDSDSNFSGSIGTTGTSQSTTGLIALAKVGAGTLVLSGRQRVRRRHGDHRRHA